MYGNRNNLVQSHNQEFYVTLNAGLFSRKLNKSLKYYWQILFCKCHYISCLSVYSIYHVGESQREGYQGIK